MDGFKVPTLPLKKPVIGPTLPKPDANEIQSTSSSKADSLSYDTPIIDPQKETNLPQSQPSASTSDSDVKDEVQLSSQQQQEVPPDMKLAYNEPPWSGTPPSALYQLLVIKNGVEVDAIDLSHKPYHVCGRLPSCDIHLEHPSISRHHAVLQYRPESDATASTENGSSTVFSNTPREMGFYLYDLSSTHGTYLTKNKLQPRCYYRMRIGQSVKFGGSSRLFVLDQGTDCSQEVVEAEAEEERAEITRKKEEYEEYLRRAEEEEMRRQREEEQMGATWGMIMDDVPEDSTEGDSDQQVQIDSEKEAYYINDPKKALKTFFDREGLDLEYESEESGPNHNKIYTIKVWLPIYTSTGESVYAEASVKGNKKAAVQECALEACRLLDADGILRESSHSHNRRSRLKELEENDYYDSDEDNFLDRTGDVERKRKRRMVRAGKINESVETYHSLAEKLSSVQKEMKELQDKLARHRNLMSKANDSDSLEDYMRVVSSQLDSTSVSKIKLKIHQLQKEETRLSKLVKVATPYQLPGSSPASVTTPAQSSVITSPSTAAEEEKDDHVQQFTTTTTSTASTDDDDGGKGSGTADEQQEMQRKMRKRALDDKVTSLLEDVVGKEEKVYGLIKPNKMAKSESDSPKPKRKQVVGPTLPPSIRKQIQAKSTEGSEWNNKDFDPDFASWIPPEDQTGDGRTKLNEKLGY